MNLLFDLDGTLTDSKLGILNCICYALGKMGIECPSFADMAWVLGPPLQSSIQRLLGDRAPESDICLAHYRERFATIGLFENEVYDGVRGVLSGFDSQGYRMFVATSKPTVYSERILDHFDLSSHFEKTYGCELDGTRSNKTHLLEHLLEVEGLDPKNTIMIGDRKHDIIAARNNGIRSIGVLYGYGSHEEISTAAPDLVAATTSEIEGCVADLRADSVSG